MVPGRAAQPRLEPVALPLPAAGVPVRGPARRERPPGQARPGVRTAGHRRVRRRLLDHRGRLRQGQPHRPADGCPGDQRGRGHRHPARAAHRLVPQHLVLGHQRGQAGAGRHRHRLGPAGAPVPGHPGTAGRQGARRHRAGAAVLRERDQRGPAVRRPAGDPLPQGRDQRPRDPQRGHRQPGPARHQVRRLVPAGGGPGRHGRAAAAAAPAQDAGPARRSARRLAGCWPPGARRPTSSTPG